MKKLTPLLVAALLLSGCVTIDRRHIGNDVYAGPVCKDCGDCPKLKQEAPVDPGILPFEGPIHFDKLPKELPR